MTMSIVVDPEREAALAAKAANDEAKVSEAQAGDEQPASDQTGTDDGLPEKFRGKSVQEIVQMYQNAESELGRKNNEIGLMRKLADELIGVRALERKAAEENQPKPSPLTANSLLDNPEEAILGVVKREALTKHEELESKVASLEERLLTEEFEKRHPGFQTTMQTQEFGSFIQGSRYRQQLGLRAAQGDFAAADELFGLYEDFSSMKQSSPQPTPEKPSARQATTVRSGGSSAGGVVPTASGTPKFTRQELLDMRINRPEEFDARQAEILEAYKNKQVR